MATGDLAAAGCANCHAVKQGNQLGFVYDPECEKEIARGSAVSNAKPTVVSITPSHKCNLRCLRCYQTDTRSTTLNRAEAEDEVLELVPVLARLNATRGEPLVFPKWVNFVEQIVPTLNPYMVFSVTTNATVLTPRMERALPKFKGLSVSVSVDGTGGTFERVRVDARFDDVVDNIRRLKSIVDSTQSPESNTGLSMCVMKSDVEDVANFVKSVVEEEVLININPATVFPADESLCCFNDPLNETSGWRDSYAKARRVLLEDYVTMQVAKSDVSNPDAWRQALQNWWGHNIDLIESATPWDALARTHYRLLFQPPNEQIEEYIAQYGDAAVWGREVQQTFSARCLLTDEMDEKYQAAYEMNDPLCAYVFPIDSDTESEDQYYPALIECSDVGWYFEVQIPSGYYRVGIAPKSNPVSSRLAGLEFRIEGGLISSSCEVNLFPAKVQWARHRSKPAHGIEWMVSNRFSRRFGSSVRSLLKRKA